MSSVVVVDSNELIGFGSIHPSYKRQVSKMCEEELKVNYRLIQNILSLDEINESVIIDYISSAEQEIVYEIVDRFMQHKFE